MAVREVAEGVRIVMPTISYVEIQCPQCTCWHRVIGYELRDSITLLKGECYECGMVFWRREQVR